MGPTSTYRAIENFPKRTSVILTHRSRVTDTFVHSIFFFLAPALIYFFFRSLLSAISFGKVVKPSNNLCLASSVIIYCSSSSFDSLTKVELYLVLRSRRSLSVAVLDTLMHSTACIEILFLDLSRLPWAIFRDQGSYSQTHCRFVTRAIACDEDHRESQHRR